MRGYFFPPPLVLDSEKTLREKPAQSSGSKVPEILPAPYFPLQTRLLAESSL